jgi:hypothetical protein
MVAYVVQKFPAFYGTLKIITVVTRVCNSRQIWERWIQYTPSDHTALCKAKFWQSIFTSHFRCVCRFTLILTINCFCSLKQHCLMGLCNEDAGLSMRYKLNLWTWFRFIFGLSTLSSAIIYIKLTSITWSSVSLSDPHLCLYEHTLCGIVLLHKWIIYWYIC